MPFLEDPLLVLNSWRLSYLSPQLEYLYFQEKKQVQQILFRIVCIYSILNSLFFAIYDSFYLNNFISSLAFNIIECFLWFLVSLISHLYPHSINQFLLVINIAKASYVNIYYLPLLLDSSQSQDQKTGSYLFIFYSLSYFIQIFLSTLANQSYLMRCISLNISILFLIFGVFMTQSQFSLIIGVSTLISIGALNFFIYFDQRGHKLLFIEKYQQKRQLERWKTLLNESFPVGVVIIKKPAKQTNLEVIFSNQACHDIFHNSNNDFIEHQLLQIVVDAPKSNPSGLLSSGINSNNQDDAFNLTENILRYFCGDKKIETEEGRPFCQFGWYLNEKQEKNHYNIIANKVTWEGESCFLIVLKDVSEKMMNDRLQEIDQYKDQLLASVTHELKTPLNGILSIAETAEQENDLTIIHKQMELIRKSGKMLEIILNDILDYSRLQKQKLRLLITKFDLVSTVDEVINLVQIQFSKPDIQIKKEIFIDNTFIQSDSNRFKQIIFNLLTNAIKFTQQGYISIIVKQSMSSACISVTVADTGVGIPLSLQKKLFQLYGTFDHSKGSNRHGVGLGLVITKNLVELLGPSDNITLKSNVGKGSSFTFDIFQELTLENNSAAEMSDVDEHEELNDSEYNQLHSCQYIPCHSNNQGNVSIQLVSPNIQQQLNDIQSPLKANQHFFKQNIQSSEILQIEQIIDSDEIYQLPKSIIAQTELIISSPHTVRHQSKSGYWNSKENKLSRKRQNTTNNISQNQIAQTPPSLQCSIKKKQPNTYFDTEYKPIQFSTSCCIPYNHKNSVHLSYFHTPTPFNSQNNYQIQKSSLNGNSNNENSTDRNLNSEEQPILKQRHNSFNSYPSKHQLFTSKISTFTSLIQSNIIQSSSNKINNCKGDNCSDIKIELENKAITETQSIQSPQKALLDTIFTTQNRILIVDDTYFNIIVLKMLLAKNPNIIIEEAFNGLDAINKIVEFNQKNQPFQLVFMDVNMPVMDGVQAIEIIRQKINDKEIPDLKIAVCSAFTDLQSKMRCLKAGADIHIAKPINRDDLEQKLLQIYQSQSELMPS